MKEIEKRDSVLTPKQQIERLLRPGSTYFNLNPFEVLQVEPDATLDEIKKKYRRLSILVHPDKNIVSYNCVYVISVCERALFTFAIKITDANVSTSVISLRQHECSPLCYNSFNKLEHDWMLKVVALCIYHEDVPTYIWECRTIMSSEFLSTNQQ